jgi:MFS family permease
VFTGLTWTMIVPYFEDIQSALDRTGRLAVLGMVAATVASAAGPGAFGFLVDHGGDYRHAFMFALLAFAASALCSIYPGKAADARRP